MEREARASVQARQGEREGAGTLGEEGGGDRSADGQQGTCAQGRGEDVVASLSHGYVVRSTWWSSQWHRPSERPNEGAAVQRSEADEHLRTLEDDQGAASAPGRPAEIAVRAGKGFRAWVRTATSLPLPT